MYLQKVKDEVEKARDLSGTAYTSESIPNLKVLVNGILNKLQEAEKIMGKLQLLHRLQGHFTGLLQIIQQQEKNLTGKLGARYALNQMSVTVKQIEQELR